MAFAGYAAILASAARATEIRDEQRAEKRRKRGEVDRETTGGFVGYAYVDQAKAQRRRKRRGRITQDARVGGKAIRHQLADSRSLCRPSWLHETDPKVRRKEKNAAKRRRQGR
jgi:hypothetical protein